MQQKNFEGLRTDPENSVHAGERAGIEAEIHRLRLLPLASLRGEWHRTFPDREMPPRLSRDLLVRTIAWKMQEETFGRFSPALARKLEQLSQQLRKSGSLDLERQAIVKPGTTLLREWQGQTYCVTAVEDGYLFRDQRFASLSEIATNITGTRWSGPRFFGLKQRSGKHSVTGSVVD